MKQHKKRAFVYVGGEFFASDITERPQPEDLTIAADSGWQTAQALDVRPAVLLGDFDSLHTIPAVSQLIRYPAHKDYTDAQLAVQFALEHGSEEITIVGGLGGRIDHTLSCLAILEDLDEKGVRGRVLNGKNEVLFLRGPAHLSIQKGTYTYLSLLTLDAQAEGITLQGCAYPMDDSVLRRGCQYAVSNRIVDARAELTLQKGALYIICAKD